MDNLHAGNIITGDPQSLWGGGTLSPCGEEAGDIQTGDSPSLWGGGGAGYRIWEGPFAPLDPRWKGASVQR